MKSKWLLTGVALLLAWNVCLATGTTGPAHDDPEILEAIEKEKKFFLEQDHNGDGHLSKAEFLEHLMQVMDEHHDAEEEGEPATLSEEDAEFAMKEYDSNGDGVVSPTEWLQRVFHESPQEAEYEDGNKVGIDQDPEDMKRIFFQWDADRDDRLSELEAREMITAAHGHNELEVKGLSNDEVGGLIWHLFDDKDKDKDGHLCLAEWLEGGGY